jgi:hypothetical protein
MLELLLIIGVASLLLSFWPEIVDWCTNRVAPWIEQELGTLPATLFRTVISWLDGAIVLTTQVLQEAWAVFGERVLRLERTYERVSTGRVREISESVVAIDRGTAIRRVEEQEIPWERLPPKVRAQMIRRPHERAAMDVRALLEKLKRKRALEEQMGLEMRS